MKPIVMAAILAISAPCPVAAESYKLVCNVVDENGRPVAAMGVDVLKQFSEDPVVWSKPQEMLPVKNKLGVFELDFNARVGDKYWFIIKGPTGVYIDEETGITDEKCLKNGIEIIYTIEDRVKLDRRYPDRNFFYHTEKVYGIETIFLAETVSVSRRTMRYVAQTLSDGRIAYRPVFECRAVKKKIIYRPSSDIQQTQPTTTTSYKCCKPLVPPTYVILPQCPCEIPYCPAPVPCCP